MKKVIFVCLLSLSLCMSQQNPTQNVQSTQPQGNAGSADMQPPVKVEASTGTGNSSTANATAAANTAQVQPSPAMKEAQIPPASTVPSNTSTSITNDTKQNSAKPEDSNEGKAKNETAPANAAGEKMDPKPEPIKNGTETKVPADKVTNGTKPDDNKKNDMVPPKADELTPKSETVKTTEKPVVLQTRAFDGPSFIGGMILTLGLLAIGFMGFKYYKNQTERNYHTL